MYKLKLTIHKGELTMYALLVIKIPDLSLSENRTAWNNLKAIISDNINTTKSDHGLYVQPMDNNNPEKSENPKLFHGMLGENVLLFDLAKSLKNFVNVTYCAQVNQLFHKVLFLDQEPEWIYS